jgi:Na+-translocating ferredoxin:NAD+ oxidoreductase subunit B
MTALLPALMQPVLALLGLGLGIGALLGSVAKYFRVTSDPVVEKINDLLPQTQCGQCGYPGCKPYAEAIAGGDAINKCPPGGETVIEKMADLLNIPVQLLDKAYGIEEGRKIAVIREAECIGCAKCIPACPVDAILGAPKFMHTVIESECTGCDLCVEPCPVDCIDLVPIGNELDPEPESTPRPGQSLFAISNESQACINCGLCSVECPVDLQPHTLYKACLADDLQEAQAQNLMHCIECSKCDVVCPSHIPLVAYYQHSKSALKAETENIERAERAKRRFELHQRRMEKLSGEEEQRRKNRAQLAKQSRQQVSSENIQAALERVKAKKEFR